MCGIAGMISNNASDLSGQAQRMSESLHHRGPDDAGWMTFDGCDCQFGRERVFGGSHEVALVHRRLSIIDLTDSGRQPMSDREGRYWIVFNGEIYNYLEVRDELVSLGHTFRSASDTEVLLAAYIEWGGGCLGRLIGMFAFVIFDIREKTLFLARDFVGIKPLYFALGTRGFAFASEIPALLCVAGVTTRACPRHVHAFLRFGMTDHDAGTLLADVRQLPPGHWMMVRVGATGVPDPIRYWDWNEQLFDIPDSFESASETVRDLLLDSIRLHMRSDVPVGAALSGGIDSSAVVMGMRHIGGSTLDIHTFSYCARTAQLDETRWMKLIATAARPTAHFVVPESQDLASDLPMLIRRQGEPFASTSMYAQYRVFQLAAEAGIKVMLDGQGADELFGGYDYYVAARIASLLRDGDYKAAAALFNNARVRIKNRPLLASLAYYLAPAVGRDALNRVAALTGLRRAGNLNRAWFREREITENERPESESASPFKDIYERDLRYYGLPSLLRFDDRNSMAWSVESRVPFLTPALASYAYHMPPDFKVSPNAISKPVLRRAMRGLVPDPILDRTDKVPFATPEAQWLSAVAPSVDKRLGNGFMSKVGPIDSQALRRQWARFKTDLTCYDSQLWRCINLVAWTAEFSVSYE